jgi:hypothetical protein
VARSGAASHRSVPLVISTSMISSIYIVGVLSSVAVYASTCGSKPLEAGSSRAFRLKGPVSCRCGRARRR